MSVLKLFDQLQLLPLYSNAIPCNCPQNPPTPSIVASPKAKQVESSILPPCHKSIPKTIPAHGHRIMCSLNFRFPISSKRKKKEATNALNSGKAAGLVDDNEQEEEEEEEEEEDFEVLTRVRSCYNDIVIVDTGKSRVLLLDSTHNVHSIINKGPNKWTSSYWDEFATLPAVIPRGPIAILGLGGGTAAHLMLQLWPSLQIQGWEIDGILIDKAREYLGLSQLEDHTSRAGGGFVGVHVGDALSPSVALALPRTGGYAGIVVDLFSQAEVLPQLHDPATWLRLRDLLMPDGRFMVNCGAARESHRHNHNPTYTWQQNTTIEALCWAFPGQVSWKKLPEQQGHNFLALTGPLPDLTAWSTVLPHPLSSGLHQWQKCFP